jgi:hypothetical protein
VATHNPFMVGSVSDSNVYALRYGTISGSAEAVAASMRRRVSSILLDTVNKAGSSNDILQEVLGLPGTRALWVEERMHAILNKYESRSVDEGVLRELRDEFSRLGMEDVFPREARRLLHRDQAE